MAGKARWSSWLTTATFSIRWYRVPLRWLLGILKNILAIIRATYNCARSAWSVASANTNAYARRYKAGQRSREARGRQKLLNRLERVQRPQDFPEMHFEFNSVVG